MAESFAARASIVSKSRRRRRTDSPAQLVKARAASKCLAKLTQLSSAHTLGKTCMITCRVPSAAAVRILDSIVHPPRALRRSLLHGSTAQKFCRSRIEALSQEPAQLHDAAFATIAALVRRQRQLSDMSAAAKSGQVELFVLSGRGAPELDELSNLPDGMHLLGTGRPDQEVKDWSKADWEKVEVLLKCGTGKDASTKQELQDIWPHLTNLKWIHSSSAGVEKLLFPELAHSSVVVTNAKGTYSHSLAEWALTACNWFAKDLPRLKRLQKDRSWDPYYVEELRGKTLGVVGYGDIGQETANIARAFKMNIAALRRRKELSQQEKDTNLQVFTPDQLNDLFAQSDYIVTALPHTDRTEKLVSAEAISSMKKTGVFINIGRGQTVDEEALIKALQEKRIRGAALDVTYTEPLPPDSALWDLDNVLLSPHCADRTTTFQAEAIQQFTDLAKLYVEGKELYNVVDKGSGY